MTTEQFPAPIPTPPTHEKRVAVVPIVIAAVVLVAALIGTLVITGLAMQPTASPSHAPVAVVPSDPGPAPVQTPAVQPPSREAGPNECVDSTGDGGLVDLASVAVELTRHGDLRVTFELLGEVPTTGTASVGIYAESREGKRAYQLSVGWEDGELQDAFAYDFDRGKQQEVDEDELQIEGSRIVAEFPEEVIKRLGRDWTWYAFSTADGTDIDACPGEVRSFDALPFER